MATIKHPMAVAADRLPDLDPEFVQRATDELHAGPFTSERLHEWVNTIAGLGTLVHVRTPFVYEIEDGVWAAAGVTVSGRHVWYFVSEEFGREVIAAEEQGDQPTVGVPPNELNDLSADILGIDFHFNSARLAT